MAIVSQVARKTAVKSGPGWPFSGQGWAIGLLTAVSLEEFTRDFQRNCGEMRRKSLNFSASFSLHHGAVNGRKQAIFVAIATFPIPIM
jgi:hypothetical protein